MVKIKNYLTDFENYLPFEKLHYSVVIYLKHLHIIIIFIRFHFLRLLHKLSSMKLGTVVSYIMEKCKKLMCMYNMNYIYIKLIKTIITHYTSHLYLTITYASQYLHVYNIICMVTVRC